MFSKNILTTLLATFNFLLNTPKIILIIFSLHLIWILFFNLAVETEVKNIIMPLHFLIAIGPSNLLAKNLK